MQHIADGDRSPAKIFCATPQNSACDDEDDAAADDLPELNFLPGIEKAGLGRIHFFFVAHDFVDVAHPLCVSRGPEHGREPVEHLKSEEKDEAQAEPGMHLAAERASAEERREPAEQPRQINAEAREECQKKEERDCPVQHPRVHRMPQQFSAIHPGAPQRLELTPRFVVETFNRSASHAFPPWWEVPVAPCAARSSHNVPTRLKSRRARTSPAPA